MAEPITWRSINAPDFRASSASMSAAASTIDSAFDGLQNTLKDRRAEEEKFAAKRTKDNTAAYLTHLASFQDPAAAEAALKSGQLTEMLRGYGSEIDAPTAIAAQQSLLPNLQQRAVQAMQFEQEGQKMKDWRVDQTQRDTLAGFEAGIRGAKTQEEFEYFKNALGIYQSLGHLTPEKVNKLTSLAEAENNAEVLNTRAAEKHTWEGKKLDADLAHMKEQERIARGQLGVSQQNANTNAIQAAGNLALSVGGKAATIAGDYSKEAAKIQEKAQEFEKNSPFGGKSYNAKDTKEIFDYAKTAGANTQDVSNFLKRLNDGYQDGKIKLENGLEIPITNKMVQMAIATGAARSSLNPFAWNGRDEEMFGDFKDLVSSSGVAQKYAEYLNRMSLYEAQSKAAKEEGIKATNALESSVAPYLDRLQSKAGVAPPKR